MKFKFLLTIIIGILFLFSFVSQSGILQAKIVNSNENSNDKWAILISNGSDTWKNYAKVLRDILTENGWQKDHIKVHCGIDANYKNFKNSFQWLENVSDENDIVLFYDNSHGNIKGFRLDDYFVNYNELNSLFGNISYKALGIFLNACHCGAAIPVLGTENRVILAASDAESTANWAFSLDCFEGFHGFADLEGNNNGHVSLEEVFNFVKEGHTSTNPLMYDGYPNDLDLTDFDIDKWPGSLDQHAMHGYTGGGLAILNEYRWYAQSFKPTYSVLSGLMLYIGIIAGNPGPLTVSIREKIEGDDLLAFTITQNNFYESGHKLFTFDIPDLRVTPDKTYWVVVKGYESNDNDYHIYKKNYDYSRGDSAWSDDAGENWTHVRGIDLNFFTFGTNIEPADNSPPEKPNPPAGPTDGKSSTEYKYEIKAIDNENDNVYFLVDWGDGNYTGWIGPYNSGETVTVKHSWLNQGNYEIRAIAKDQHDLESMWSDPLSVSMPKHKSARCIFSIIWELFNLIQRFLS